MEWEVTHGRAIKIKQCGEKSSYEIDHSVSNTRYRAGISNGWNWKVSWRNAKK